MRGHSSPWLLPTEEIFGVIRALNPFRLTGASRDYIVLPGMDLLNGEVSEERMRIRLAINKAKLQVRLRTLTCPPERDYISIGNTFSYHQFSADMLVFWGVTRLAISKVGSVVVE